MCIRDSPSPGDDLIIDEISEKMNDLEGIQIELQDDRATLADVRDNFDAVIARYPEMKEGLKADANIVHSADFESAIVSIQSGREGQLSQGEKDAVAKLLLPSSAFFSSAGDGSLRESARKRRKLRGSASFKLYQDTRFIVPTSNVCERFFSTSRYAIGERRHGLSTENLEAQMFLHFNMHLWDVLDVANLE